MQGVISDLPTACQSHDNYRYCSKGMAHLFFSISEPSADTPACIHTCPNQTAK